MSDLPTLAAPLHTRGGAPGGGGGTTSRLYPPPSPHLAKGHNCPNSL